MKHRWLTLIGLSLLTGLTFLFFSLWLQSPYQKEKISQKTSERTLEEPSITFLDPKKGGKNPQVKIVVFSDFLCEACKNLSQTMNEILTKDPSVQFVWKSIPNDQAHSLAVSAAIAAQCAANQGGFWNYHDALFQNQVILTENQFVEIAKQQGMKIDVFEACYQKKEPLAILEQNRQEALELGITSTPTLFIGKERLVGSPNEQELLLFIKGQKTSL
ncbi:hypothetical protein CO172_03020 [Candidatus Uhrbacteria bacterium CG_4_9_14_3_um_filter_36_7]|uniref:Thioredoxin domain-containing protein n=1 Tax=Candidatus Uhrbacteria bacterium CG_4_9_14_3_um_filter_36_7 TaxID=1975033 RepID=A0A2M7XGZ3_9BACT|nr:MAG: hypothetical protein CO172_03020 [Candidatus Uhrbacteria bacterium CG_4_9_14_3_um_filter_36_7]